MARQSPAETVREAVRTWEQHEPAFKSHWEAIRKDRDFALSGRHYSAEDLDALKAKDRIAPITLDQYDAERFISSQVSSSEIYIEVEHDVPEELVTDPMEYNPEIGDFNAPEARPARDIRWARWALEADVLDPYCGYQRVRDAVALDGIAARSGWAMLEWDPAQGRRGRIFASAKNAENCLWHSSYLHPHQPGNPFFMYRDTVDYEWLRNVSGWKNVEKVLPDGATELVRDWQKLPPELRRVTVQFCYYAYDTTTKRRLEPNYEAESLPKAERYAACEDCDWESGPAGSAPLPRRMRCPQCGGIAERIDVSGKLVPTAAYLKGRRYLVVAVKSPDAGPLVDEGWPGNPSCYPLMYFVPNPHPQEISGLSYTAWTSDYQCELDAMFRLGHEYMQRSHDWLFVEMDAFKDANRQTFQFDSTSDWVGFTESREALGSVTHIKGSELPASVTAWWNQIGGSFRQTKGAGQLGIAPEQLKGMQVGTTQRFLETGDVPVDAIIERFRFEETFLLQAWHDMQRSLRTLADWLAVVGKNGEKAFRAMRGENLPSAKVRVRGKPTIKSSEMDKFQKLSEILANPNLTPATLEIAAQATGVPDDWVQKVKKERWPQMAGGNANEAAASAGMPGAPGPGPQSAGPPGAGPGMVAPPNGNGFSAPVAVPAMR